MIDYKIYECGTSFTLCPETGDIIPWELTAEQKARQDRALAFSMKQGKPKKPPRPKPRNFD